MSFWGLVVSAAEPKKVAAIKAKDGELVHLSSACLAPATAEGCSAKLIVTTEGLDYCIANLKEGGQESCSLDLFLDSKATAFSVKGKAVVHLTGYLEAEEDMDMDDDDDMSDAPATKLATKPPSVASPRTSPKAGAASPKVEAKQSPKASPKAAEPDDDDDEEEEEEEEEEEDAPPPPPAKKAKTDSPAKSTPASPGKTAPSSPKTGPATGAVIDTYVQKMVKFLKDNGQTNIGLLGSKVPRPEGAPKMKAVLEQHKDKFVVAGDKVTAK
mmetsp:Transcript_61229/g.96583  ORF Transcript_61229/g.96583 Transcript_61229/m.96583 type:complete len:270 (-) Transcript_61229:116-925(-)